MRRQFFLMAASVVISASTAFGASTASATTTCPDELDMCQPYCSEVGCMNLLPAAMRSGCHVRTTECIDQWPNPQYPYCMGDPDWNKVFVRCFYDPNL